MTEVPPPQGPPPPPPPPPGYGPGYPPPQPTDETLWAVLAHLSIFVLALIGPLLIYLLVGDQRPFAKRHALEALNFHITLTIASIVCAALFFLIVPLLLLVVIWIAAVVLAILAAVKAGNREDYRYPFTWRLVT